MSETEKILMYKEKRGFIKALSDVFKAYEPSGSTISGLRYEVYRISENSFVEWLIIEFYGGAELPMPVSGNSNLVNLEVLAHHCYGGDYSYVPMYLQTKEHYEEFEV